MKHGLEIQISELEAKLPQGQIKGDFSLGLKKDMTMVHNAETRNGKLFLNGEELILTEM